MTETLICPLPECVYCDLKTPYSVMDPPKKGECQKDSVECYAIKLGKIISHKNIKGKPEP